MTGTSEGTIVHFEKKTPEWLAGAAGQHLPSADGDREALSGLTDSPNP